MLSSSNINFAFIVFSILVSLFTSKTAGTSLAESQAVGGIAKLFTQGGASTSFITMALSIPAILMQSGLDTTLLPASINQLTSLIAPVFGTLSALGLSASVAIGAWRKAASSGALPDMTVAQNDTLDGLHKAYASLTALEQAFGPLAKVFDAATTPYGKIAQGAGRLVLILCLVGASGFFLAYYVMMYYAKQAGTSYVIDKRIGQAMAT